jgi:hypothetical protein
MISPSGLRDLFQGRREPALHGLLNLWTVEEDILIGVDLQYTRLLRLTCPDVLYFSEGELAQHAVGLGRLLDTLPDNCTAQLLVRVRWDGGNKLGDYAAAPRPSGEMIEFAVQTRLDFLKKQPYKRVEHYLALTTYPAKTDLLKLQPRPLLMSIPDYKGVLATQHSRRVAELKKIVSASESALRDARIGSKRLGAEEIYDYLYERLNPTTSRTMPRPKITSSGTLRSQIALNACDAQFDRAVLDGWHHRAVNIVIRPTAISGPGITRLLDNIPGDYDFSVAIHSLNQERATNELSFKATVASVINGLSLFTKYHEADIQTHEADALLAHVKAEGQKLYLMTCHVILRHVTPNGLASSTDKAVLKFRGLDDAIAVVDDMNHLPLFLASLPGHTHLNARSHIIPTDGAARFITMSASWDGCPDAQFMTPTDDEKLLPVNLFDPKELTAKHGLVLGVTGEGKSVLVNSILTSFYCASEDNHVIIIDNGNSYQRLCNLLGGQYLEPTLDGTYSFNPFIDRKFLEDDEDQSDFLTFMTLLVQLMLRKQDLTNNEKTIIHRCVMRAYELSKGRTPILSDLHKAFGTFGEDEEDRKIARDFYKNFTIWVEGPYSRLFNRESTFDASSRFVVFDLNKMTDPAVKPVLLAIIKSVIHPKVANKRLRKLLALDEVWMFLADKAGADLVKEWYKAGRRFNIACYVITQSPHDLLSSPVADAVAQSSSVKWILNIGIGYELLSKLDLSPEEIETVRNLGKNAKRDEYRNVYLRLGSRKAVIRSILSKLEYWLYTTDPNDVNMEARLREAHPDWSNIEVLRALAEGRS